MDPVRVEPFKIPGGLEFTERSNIAGNRPDESKSRPFTEVLKQSMVTVNDLQVRSDTLTQRLALGEVEDISEVSIAVEKAELALRLMVQIRDKLVDAYSQISRMTT